MVMSPKTKYVIFNIRKNYNFLTTLKYHEIVCNHINCSCPSIELVDEIKYLGLIIDSNLSWKSHVNYTKTKLIKYSRMFYMMRTMCNPEILRMLYFAFVNSKLEYGLAVWGGTYLTTLKPLIVLQKSYMRSILNRPRLEHTEPLFRVLRVLPFRNMYIYKVLRLFYNNSSMERNKVRERAKTLRRKLNVPVPKPKLTIFKKYYLFTAPKFFNVLPDNIKIINIRNIFLKSIRQLLVQMEDNSLFYNSVM